MDQSVPPPVPALARVGMRETLDDTQPRTIPPQSPLAPSASTFSQLLRNDNNILDISEGDTLHADLREAIKKMSTVIPFLLLLVLRFILAYITTFFSLAVLNIYEWRIHTTFAEQISLKSSTNRNTLRTLFIVSSCFLFLIYMLSPVLLGCDITERLSLNRFHPENFDFISIVMLCYFSDTTVRVLLGTIKLAVFFILNPRSRVLDAPAANLFPSIACFHWNAAHALSSITVSGITDSLISFLPLRSFPAHRDSGVNLSNLEEGSGSSFGDTDVESGPLLNNSGGRRRLVYSSSRDGSVSTSERERSSSISSVADSMEHQSEVMSFMRLKKMLSSIDAVGAFYRCILPVPVWMSYFGTGPGSVTLVVCYIFFKSMMSMEYVVMAFKAVHLLVVEKLEFGAFATPEEIAQSGSTTCSICFDTYYRPITLNCKHIFCQHCIHEWLDHENSCPVCRAEVSRDKSSQSIRNLSASTMPILM